jgi:hypothetical protein
VLESSEAEMRRATIDSVTLIGSLLFAVAVAAFFRTVWHAPPTSLAYNVPIAAPFAVFFVDRLHPRPVSRRGLLVDLGVMGLALLRVFAPPLPWASGHTLFTTYGALSARRWPLRVLASAVLLEVIYMKVFVTGGWLTMTTGLAAGSAAAFVYRRLRPPLA